MAFKDSRRVRGGSYPSSQRVHVASRNWKRPRKRFSLGVSTVSSALAEILIWIWWNLYTFFLSSHGACIKTDHISGHKTCLSKFKRSMLSAHSGIKLKLQRTIARKIPKYLEIKQHMCVHVKTLQLCPTLCNPMDCSLSGSSVHGILQARTLEWVAILSFRGSSRPRDWTRISYISCIGKQVLYHQRYWGSSRYCYW